MILVTNLRVYFYMEFFSGKMQAEQSILDAIQRGQLKWYGHLLRMEASRWPKRKTATIMEEPSDGLREN